MAVTVVPIVVRVVVYDVACSLYSCDSPLLV